MAAMLAQRMLSFLGAILLAWTVMAVPATAREIVDMMGRKVTVPDVIHRVYTSAPPVTLAVYAMARETLIGFSFPSQTTEDENCRRFIDPKVLALPDLGNLMGHGKQADVEQLLSLHPDVVIAWGSHYIDTASIEQRFAKLGIPVVFLTLDTLSEFPDAFLILGKMFDREERGKELAAYIKNAVAKVDRAVAGIPANKRQRVFYVESPDGLSTECDTSFHVEPVALAGGINVYSCKQSQMVGLERVSIEQVVKFAPDLILSQDLGFAEHVGSDPRWRNVKAVADHAVLAVPKIPFNWMDRPPCFTRALGIQWLANKLYPHAFPVDIRAETKAFHKLFFDLDLSDADVDLILK